MAHWQHRVVTMARKEPHLLEPSNPLGAAGLFLRRLLISPSFYSSSPFPILDSFPRIFHFGDSTPTTLAVTASLSTSTSVARRIRAVGQIVRRSINIEDREALSNSLESLCEEYEDGYDSGMDDYDD